MLTEKSWPDGLALAFQGCKPGQSCHQGPAQLGSCVTFHTTNSTPSPSLLETLHRHIVDHHHYQSNTPFACPDSSHTGPGPLAHYYMQKHLYPIFGTSHVNRLCSTHVYLFSILEYTHAWSKYHMFVFPCHMFVLFFHMFILLFHMLLPVIPHATSNYSTCSLPFIFQFFQYISIKLLVLYFLSFEY